VTLPRGFAVRPAAADELGVLPAIEREAGGRFAAIASLADVPEVLMPPGALADALARGQVWVAVAPNGTVVGFAYADLIDGAVHLEELDVLEAFGRRGLGRALVAAVIADARRRGLTAVTLTTFRDVPWNAPFYARLGFRILPADALTPGLTAIFALEAARGLPRELRVVMRCDLDR